MSTFWLIFAGGACLLIGYLNPMLETLKESPKEDPLYIYRYKLTLGMFTVGITLLTMGIVYMVPLDFSLKGKIMGLVFLFFAVFSTILALSLRFGIKSDRFLWVFINPSKFPERDKHVAAYALLIMAFGFAFGFVLYFWS
jgi:hypothetical protein